MSASPAPEGQSQWVSDEGVCSLTLQKEYKNAEGRVYWSHAITKQSLWEKPDELKVGFKAATSVLTADSF